MNLYSRLTVSQLELHVILGWPEIERQQQQTVLLDLEIKLATPPRACTSDHLDDAICYASLTQTIRDQLASRKFHLIEHLSCEIYRIVKEQLPSNSQLNVCITKHPPIQGLTGGVSFTYGDIAKS